MKKPIVSGQVMEQLQAEVLKVVERVQVKDTTIQALKANLQEYTVREKILKKELKRTMKRSSFKSGETNKIIKAAREAELMALVRESRPEISTGVAESNPTLTRSELKVYKGQTRAPCRVTTI
jgi:hypothetical protein